MSEQTTKDYLPCEEILLNKIQNTDRKKKKRGNRQNGLQEKNTFSQLLS